MTLSFIGDVHGLTNRYHLIQRKCNFSLQLGDFGFGEAWSWIKATAGVDPERHKVLAGNHDMYPLAKQAPHYLGDYGVAQLGGVSFFFVRGANSVDRPDRTENVDWWEEEELTESQVSAALASYRAARPDVVVSHDCPTSVLPFFITNPKRAGVESITNQCLQRMLNEHAPKVWVFGHHHKTKQHVYRGTHFQCVGELKRWDMRG